VSKDSCGKKPARPPSVGSQSGEDGGAVVSNERQIQQLRELQQVHKENSGPKNEDTCIDENGILLEEIDPNEPGYYLCGDLRFGTIRYRENVYEVHLVPSLRLPES
jgi:hypothetical protein